MSRSVTIVDEWFSYQEKIGNAQASVDPILLQYIFMFLIEKIQAGHQIFTFGNGGSASIADHFATDLMKGVATDTTVRPKIRSLSTNGPLLSAIANDLGYEETLSYQLDTFASKGDILIAISSSGNSQNIMHGILAAERIGMPSIGLSGFDWNNFLNTSSTINVHVDSKNYGVVEDVHANVMHVLSQSLRKYFAEADADISQFTF